MKIKLLIAVAVVLATAVLSGCSTTGRTEAPRAISVIVFRHTQIINGERVEHICMKEEEK